MKKWEDVLLRKELEVRKNLAAGNIRGEFHKVGCCHAQIKTIHEIRRDLADIEYKTLDEVW